MPQTTRQEARQAAARVPVVALTVIVLLAGLPFAVWLDLRALSDRTLRHQAAELSAVIDGIRGFYGRHVVGRVLAAGGSDTKVVHNYLEVPGAIPIPATLSLELGRVISEQEGTSGAIAYRFVSDFPFLNRSPHKLDDFERGALERLRVDPKAEVVQVEGGLFDRKVRLATPVILGEACVGCHNNHPESPKRDWKAGDVRGIQEIVVRQPLASNIFAFKFLLIYLIGAATVGLLFIAQQHRQAGVMRRVNRELELANDFLATISMKIAKYLSPQIYKSIFSGQRDVVIATERKKLTIFFSDIKDFTATTERLQPEELTLLLNEYLTEMSAIAIGHGGTVDKFVGDAMLVFFGDPETKGVAEDARACLRMAVDMQRRLAELNAKWRNRGIEAPFKVRMGINTGYCNVGNFGSNDRMDYTIIGAEANLAARLQSIAPPGRIVLAYETYAHVRDMVQARPLEAITMKGISRQVLPYEVEGLIGDLAGRAYVIAERVPGLEIYLDTSAVDDAAAAHARELLQEAIAALDARRRNQLGIAD
ncbi:adenylate/guanylate cyclase domain-containing protein [Desertibaculum subflavum]|uniref:adenylate/guanylate cyclase domain-containing protein n=1 Tax=Desertibaculum subflavum TaxID=2268458 RepID=UPI000E66416A